MTQLSAGPAREPLCDRLGEPVRVHGEALIVGCRAFTLEGPRATRPAACPRHRPTRRAVAALALLAGLGGFGRAAAQDLEPRRWAHLPMDMGVAGLAYTSTEADVSFDPVTQLKDVKLEMHGVVASYVRTLDVAGRSARLDVAVPFMGARWDGLQAGVPASARRNGFADPWVRFSMLLVGGPALHGEAYRAYRAQRPNHTVVGAGLGVMLPLGEYKDDKLLNLGQNRFAFRPQVGVVHTRGPWSYELTGSAFVYTRNDDFLRTMERTQDPLYACQGHVVRTLGNGFWVAASAGYSWGGESEIDGVSKDDPRRLLLSAFAFGVPVSATQGLKVMYLRGSARSEASNDSDSLALAWSVRF